MGTDLVSSKRLAKQLGLATTSPDDRVKIERRIVISKSRGWSYQNLEDGHIKISNSLLAIDGVLISMISQGVKRRVNFFRIFGIINVESIYISPSSTANSI